MARSAPSNSARRDQAAQLRRLRYRFAAVEVLLRNIEAELRRLSPLPPPDSRQEQAGPILAAVCREYKLSRSALISRARPACYTEPRHVAAFLIRIRTGITTSEVARLLGLRDHSTICFAVKKIQARLETEAPFRARLARLAESLP